MDEMQNAVPDESTPRRGRKPEPTAEVTETVEEETTVETPEEETQEEAVETPSEENIEGLYSKNQTPDENELEKESRKLEVKEQGLPEDVVSLEMEEAVEAAAVAAAEKESENDDSKRGLSKASRTRRRKIYGNEHVVGQEDVPDTFFKTLENERRKEKDTFADALPQAGRSGKVLRGIINGVIPGTPNTPPIATAQLKDSHGFFEVRIPAQYLYNYDNNDPKFTDEEGNQRLMQEIVVRQNSEIDFIPLYVDEPNEIVYADRLRAMQQTAYYNYLYETKRTGKPLIEVGKKNKSKVAGMVTKVGRYGIVVECKGAETYIKNEELSYNRIDNANEYYHVGQWVSVRVLEVNTEHVRKGRQQYTLVNIVGSIKQADDMKPIDMYWNKFIEGGIYSGVIKQSHDNQKGKKYWVTLQGKLDCICLPPMFGIPRVGQSVAVQIEHKKEYPGENGETIKQLQGKITRLY